MISALIQFSLKHRLLIFLLALLLLVYGGLSIKELPVDVFPNLNRPTVTIFSEAHGLAPEDVEALITQPIENAVYGASGVVRVRSASSVGLSIVWVEFDWGVDNYFARQVVAERLQQTERSLPEGIEPVMGPIASIMGEVMLIGLTSEDPTVDAMMLRTIADWDIRKRLLSVPGVAQVTTIGGELKQYQVRVDADSLLFYGLGLDDVEAAIERSGVNATGGFVLTAYREGLIRILARADGIDDLKKIVVAKQSNDMPALTLENVARVSLGGPLAKRGDASVNANPAVMLSVQKQPDADTVKLTRKIEYELKQLKKTMPPGVVIHDDIFKQSRFIQTSILNVQEAIRDGAVLVAIILFVFLLNFRTTFITLTAIPLSFIITIIVFKVFGLSINTMTLGGLAIAIGELIDDAVVDVENVFRRLRENRQRKLPRPALAVVYEASSEIRNSIFFATMIVILVFLPLFAMGGIEGKIFIPLGVAYVVSLLASLLVALTVTPVLCSWLLPSMRSMKNNKDGFLVTCLKKAEASVLACVLPRARLTLFLAGVLFFAALYVAFSFGKEFLPGFNEGSVTINILSPPGTSLDESNRIGSLSEKLILEVPEVSKTGRRTGRAEMDDHAEGVHSSEIEVELADSQRGREEILSDIRQRLATIPGVVINIGQPISHRIDHMLSGVRAQIAIKLFGDDLRVLREKAQQVKQLMEKLDGVVDLQVEKQIMIPQLHIELDREKAKRYGVTLGEAAEYIEVALKGKVVTQIVKNNKTFDVVLMLDEAMNKEPTTIANLSIKTVNGHAVPLGLIANIEEAKGPNIINRENVMRRIVVQANVSGQDLVGVVQKLKEMLAEQVELPQGYYITYGGQFESQASAAKTILWLSVLSLVGIFLVLYGHFNSINLAAQVMISIPFAFIGAVAGVWLCDSTFSIATLVGFVTLTGIAARNGIMMITHYLYLMRHEGEGFNFNMLLRGTQERLVPVLMTALATSLALVPFILTGDQPGKEILHPVAVVIFSGLISSTILNLIITPIVFWKCSAVTIKRLLPDVVVDV